MQRIIYYITLPVLLFVVSLWVISHASQASTKTALGYQEISPVMASFAAPGQVTVAEFFGYGCPACYSIEPDLEAWLAKHKEIVFYRVPSLFRPEWLIYAKAYYVAKHLGISEKITPALFKAIQDEGRDLSTREQMADFFAEHGVNKSQFESIFDFSPEIDGQVARADKLFHDYKIFEIPTFVINGQYLTNAAMTDGSNQKLFEIIETLTKKSSPHA